MTENGANPEARHIGRAELRHTACAVRAVSDGEGAATRRLTHNDEARRGSAARLSLVLLGGG
jgi:hypothetical protein